MSKNKTYRLPHLEVVEADTAPEFQERFNARMKAIHESEGPYLNGTPAVEFVHELGFCAFITYEVLEELKPQTVKDEFHLNGVYFHCRNCPHLELPADRRVKYGSCKYSTTGRAHRDHEACELFYKWIAANEVSPLSCDTEVFVSTDGEIRTRHYRRRED